MSNKKVMRFSKSKLMALKPAKQDYFVRDELGAGLRIKVSSKSGTKTFQVQKRHAGKVKTITLGKFVDANAVFVNIVVASTHTACLSCPATDRSGFSQTSSSRSQLRVALLP
ncbi:Arm DNA-binding domain-containing protein, partial [Salinisphaera sp. G21_0]|uniref:Arm DNA-binding domain-containing protein n=1 Tax=Salinisphaera sp. G21_0 TaxID=2821094 RepID=UPI001ADBE917